VDLDGVGQELGSVAISARVVVPTVAFEPYEQINFGEVFIRYAFYQCLVLHNTSSLPAKFQILPQDDQSKQLAQFEADQPQGNIPPASKTQHNIISTPINLRGTYRQQVITLKLNIIYDNVS
jgi:hypothetical protein